MEGEKRVSSRSIRKPLSDCTNSRPSKLFSQTLTKPPFKPPNFSTAKPSNLVNFNKRKQNPNSQLDKVAGNDSLLKSHTSTGSNDSPVSDCVLSQPRKPIKHAGDRDCKKSGPSAVQIQRQVEQTRKDKGKSVEATPINKACVILTTREVQISSSAASGNVDGVSRPPLVEDHNVDEQRRKDKGKMVVETPIIQISSSGASGNVDGVSRLPSVEDRDVDEQRRKDKGKMVIETPIIQISVPQISHPVQTSSSAASDNVYLPGPAAYRSQRPDIHTRKDKEMMVQQTPDLEGSEPMTPSSLIMSSPAASGTDDRTKTSLIVYNQRRSSQRKKHAVGSITMPVSCPPDKRTKKKGVQLDGSSDGHSGSHTDPLPLHKKKRSHNKSDDTVHLMPEEEVAKLKAYYVDIDAFELPEEVASENEME